MIGMLTGRVESVEFDTALIEVGGVGFVVFMYFLFFRHAFRVWFFGRIRYRFV